jgi:hypothetical protein
MKNPTNETDSSRALLSMLAMAPGSLAFWISLYWVAF